MSKMAATRRQDFMMSHPEDNVKPPSYETIMSNGESTGPMSDVSLTNILENDSPPPPAYYPPTPNLPWSPHSVIPPSSLDNITPQNTESSPTFYKTFLKSKPKALGIIIIFVAIVEIALGIALGIITFSQTIESGIPFWGPVFYIIAGSLTLAAYSKPNICMIKGSFSMTSISCIISVIAVILNAIDLATIPCHHVSTSNDYIDSNNNNDGNDYDGFNDEQSNQHDNHQSNPHNHHNGRSSYQMQCPDQLGGVYAVLALLLITNVLLFLVTLTLSVFGCRSLSERRINASQVYVIPNDGATKKSDAFPELACIPAQPPPYTAKEVKATPQY